jgi:phosphate/phosphite/phosphonate ABC transporter binding protein
VRLGLIPLGDGESAGERVRGFADAVSDALGCPVVLHASSDYRVLVSAIEQGLVDLAWLPPLSAARVTKSGACAPAAIAVRGGMTSYMTALVALGTSQIRSLADLKQVRAAWVDRESASGYVVIRAALRELGVSLVDAFTQEMFVRSHAEVVRALKSGQVDVGATCFGLLGPTEPLRILAQAGPIPSDILAVHKSVAPEVRDRLERGLVEGSPAYVLRAARELMQAEAFARPTRAHGLMLDRLYATI